MSHLIQMRQRIKAIETIKKITHAMRLIAMSTHLRLRSKKTFIEQYNNEIAMLFAKLHNLQQQWQHPFLQKREKTGRTLIILIGSQKGLCGNFNTELFAFFAREIEKYQQPLEVIAIGKKIIEYIKETSSIVKAFNEFNTNNLQAITQSIISHIVTAKEAYDSVIVYSNYSKTFFTQKPQQSILFPLAEITPMDLDEDEILSEYHWEQSPEEIMHFLAEQLLHTTLYSLLFQSLIAEQAARFIAMDNSTRNASKLLDTMRLNYNKVRQSKITRELTDLAGSFF